MEEVQFPDPNLADPDGLLCVGGTLDGSFLISAYSQGIFPWPQEGLPILWFAPPERGVLEFAALHLSRRYARARRKLPYRMTFNHDFVRVIETCARTPRPGQSGTWITSEMVSAYCRLHQLGQAHSVEVWAADELVGGLYGVYIAGVFSGESMFFRQPHASKEALLALVHVLRGNGLTWLDTQMVTPVVRQMGGRTIPRREFLDWHQQRKGQARLRWPEAPLLAGGFDPLTGWA